ncbi:hypothetical protein OBBRIDRAFT_802192 [Obba rivulosa]|uniref:HNH nuclease domain-containing protein n=1 Tax=Obba rivulosa TaxID=1052685 RepID=A0A8E2B683_9APHY|nr:hypothetical protein OBBRIDRAFT_802192 [Obba rivulosa]
MPQPLPENPFNAILEHAEFQAYGRCRELEATCSTVAPPRPGVTEKVAARILGYMLIHAPSPTGRTAIANDINGCKTKDDLHTLGNMFKDFILRCYLDVEQALERDRYCCVFGTGFDHSTVISTTEILRDPDKRNYAANVLAMFRRYGDVEIDRFISRDVHDLRNVMTLGIDAHLSFDALEIWLQATEKVAHLSGAAEYVEKVLRDIEEMKVLASNGGSADLHNALLSRISSLVISH